MPGVLLDFPEWKDLQDSKEPLEEPDLKESLDYRECLDNPDLLENYPYFLQTSCSRETPQPQCLSEDPRETSEI